MAARGRPPLNGHARVSPTDGIPPKEKKRRSSHFQNMMYRDILHSQRNATDAKGELADTLLICNGGTIRVHAFILQAASPFVRNIFASLGENFPHALEIILPDFHVKSIERMLSLIYKGYVDLRSEKEMKSLRETLDFFKITGVDTSSNGEKFVKIQGSLMVHKVNHIPQDIFKRDPVDDGDADEDNDDWAPMVTDDSPAVMETPQVARRRVRFVKDNEDSDHKVETGEDSNGVEGSSRKRARPEAGNMLPVIKLSRVDSTDQKVIKVSSSSSTVTTPTTSTKSTAAAAKTEKEEDSGTDDEDENWEKPNYKDKEWFVRESCRCQCCNKTHSKLAEASNCINTHKHVRCYFCFKCFSSTEILFKHFKRRHKQAGRESTLICPFCDNPTPYKSVSCHVISVHLANNVKPEVKEGEEKKNPEEGEKRPPIASPAGGEVRRGPGRPPTTSVLFSGTTNGPGPRSRSSSVEIVTERAAPKKVKVDVTSPPPPSSSPGKKKLVKKKGPVIKLPGMKKVQKSGENEPAPPTGECSKKKELLEVPDLDWRIEKVMENGKTLIFHIKKKRLEEERENDPSGAE